MTDKLKVVAAIREALEHATPGPWIGAGPSFGDDLPRYINEIIADRDDEEDCITICEFPFAEHDEENEANAALITACNPEAITTVLDALDAALERVKVLEAERDRFERNRDMWKGQCERQAAALTTMRGTQDVAVKLLRECAGVLEVSAAIFESDDAEPLDALIESVTQFIAASMAGKGTTE